ncbi:peptide chain release factor N(5)-glutamine methyltransferase [Paraglaciecola aquimarina]|uniref:Release factor glutamine methyltransferase n=1 Tax=Paraglaciecola algarum TaxID=3050085 RepID=A0ABS9D9V2_9ALTE|nr:peptide chain release factor N(5)-glutamine methyltransferase [Paraglaciecola sp. G1-23]MCF2949743.1 peptide chain release factor N(5)-glutamine methyltransferase [Paraglaciecola sp. G1-23]
MTIAQAIQWAKQQLSDHQISDDGLNDSSKIDSRVLLCACLDCEPVYLHTWPEKELTHEQQDCFERFVAKRIDGHPVAHIIGYRDFWSLRLNVSPATLIPRPETELLVELALELPLPLKAKVLDLGTGTGAIALSLAAEKPSWQVCGLDKSSDAVDLAIKNGKFNQLPKVNFVQSDWFSAVQGKKFDLIVTNPPYVESTSEYLSLGDVRFEPASALTSGPDGLDDIRLIVQQARDHMSPNAWLLIEHGFQQGEAVNRILELNGYCNLAIKNDLNGLPRISFARFC